MNDTIKKLPVTKDRHGNELNGFVKLADIPNRDTTLIMQRYLLTKIETSITRDEAFVLVQALLEHFTLPAPTTIPHGHGPVGGFYALLDEARAQDHQNIALSRGHANMLAEHIAALKRQLGELQNWQTNDRVRRLNEHAAIVNLLGHVEDGSDQTVTIFQDDATKTWSVKAGHVYQYGRTLAEALRAHFPGDDEESQQINKSLSTGSRPVDKWDGVPDECAATGQSCEYAPEGMNGEMQCKYCGKSEDDKNADV